MTPSEDSARLFVVEDLRLDLSAGDDSAESTTRFGVHVHGDDPGADGCECCSPWDVMIRVRRPVSAVALAACLRKIAERVLTGETWEDDGDEGSLL